MSKNYLKNVKNKQFQSKININKEMREFSIFYMENQKIEEIYWIDSNLNFLKTSAIQITMKKSLAMTNHWVSIFWICWVRNQLMNSWQIHLETILTLHSRAVLTVNCLINGFKVFFVLWRNLRNLSLKKHKIIIIMKLLAVLNRSISSSLLKSLIQNSECSLKDLAKNKERISNQKSPKIFKIKCTKILW